MQFGIIGKTLTHSFSAEIHPKLFNCKYEKCELSENEIPQFMAKKDFKGINVTIPYKKAVIPFIDILDETAKSTGVVNTVINKNGVLYGYNTDFSGLCMLINKSGVSIKDKLVLIFGSGATSITARAVALSMGAKDVIRLSRSEKEDCDSYKNIEKYYEKASIIINTTPCGTYPNIYETAADITSFKHLDAVFDVVYNPIKSKLICDAEKMGVTALGGGIMLVFQAVFAARLFSGKDISDEKGFEIYEGLIKGKQNIVLIGMPSSGKTTVGKALAKALNRDFVDTDFKIEEKYGKSPKEIISELGEEFFRTAETDAITEVSKRQGIVIASGGGSVLREINADLLKENGKLVFLEKSLQNLASTDSRPLSDNLSKLEKMFSERTPIYKKYADLTVDANADKGITVNKIIKELNL